MEHRLSIHGTLLEHNWNTKRTHIDKWNTHERATAGGAGNSGAAGASAGTTAGDPDAISLYHAWEGIQSDSDNPPAVQCGMPPPGLARVSPVGEVFSMTLEALNALSAQIEQAHSFPPRS